MLKGLVLLFALQTAGELATRAWGIPLPAAIIGLLLMLLLMRVWPECAETVAPAADALLKNFALFLIPIGPSLLLLHELWRSQGAAIAAVVMVATLLTMVVTAATFTLARRWMPRPVKEAC